MAENSRAEKRNSEVNGKGVYLFPAFHGAMCYPKTAYNFNK